MLCGLIKLSLVFNVSHKLSLRNQCLKLRLQVKLWLDILDLLIEKLLVNCKF